MPMGSVQKYKREMDRGTWKAAGRRAGLAHEWAKNTDLKQN